mmetsp:Transcript_48890/g.127672  ORF Transcript_48890/g.127672 Transcript_48890/m.127672 type:complete len:240 (+) Transcript_48890:130-849(+)
MLAPIPHSPQAYFGAPAAAARGRAAVEARDRVALDAARDHAIPRGRARAAHPPRRICALAHMLGGQPCCVRPLSAALPAEAQPDRALLVPGHRRHRLDGHHRACCAFASLCADIFARCLHRIRTLPVSALPGARPALPEERSAGSDVLHSDGTGAVPHPRPVLGPTRTRRLRAFARARPLGEGCLLRSELLQRHTRHRLCGAAAAAALGAGVSVPSVVGESDVPARLQLHRSPRLLNGL